MREYTFQVFPKTESRKLIRYLGAEGQLLAQRELPETAIQALLDAVETQYYNPAPRLAELGARLYEWLDGPTERWLEKALTDAPGVAIHIDVAERLRHLPWEVLARGGGYLCANPLRPFTPARRVSAERRAVAAANRPLRLLFMACSPENTDPVLDFEAEESRILEATQGSVIELVVEESGSLAGLRERVEFYGPGYFDVFHLTGHANVHEGRPIFVMEDDLGSRADATAEEIATAFSGNWPRLVFVSGCKTGLAADQGSLPSLAEALVRAGAPAVLGWALPVGDHSATMAAAELYAQLSVGKRADEAVARARQKLAERRSHYWHLLRLYTNATPLSEHVTAPGTPGRARQHVREAAREFVDAGAKMEVCPRSQFVGRRRLIQRGLRVLRSREGQPGFAEGVLLHGMGGLGKSSLAARLCERLPGHKRFVVVGRVDEVDFLRVLSDGLNSGEAIADLNRPNLSLKHRLRLLLQGLLESEPALFIFDDFEHNLDRGQDEAPELTTDGVARLMPPALEILTALLAAIRETASESRAIVTCRYMFPLPGPAQLAPIGLPSLRGAELHKKIDQLGAFRSAGLDEAIRARAVALSAGNPRLLERLALVLADATLDQAAILSALEASTEAFREQTLLRALMERLPAAGRDLLARLSIYQLPVERAAIRAIVEQDGFDAQLERAIALGLVEAGREPRDGSPRYFVSPILPIAIAPETFAETCRRAVQYLYQTRWVEAKSAGAEWLLEIHRLALLAAEKEIAVTVGDRLATSWVNGARYREALALCDETLRLGDDYHILQTLARAQETLGESELAMMNYERALSQCPIDNHSDRAGALFYFAGFLVKRGALDVAARYLEEASAIYEKLGDVRSRAVTLGDIARLRAQAGDVEGALKLHAEMLEMFEKLGDVRERAVTLGDIARLRAQAGDVEGPLKLHAEMLEMFEKLGDVRERAVTLTDLARLAARQNDLERARLLNLDAARTLAALRAWIDLALVMFNLGSLDVAGAPQYLAQILWLALRVQVPVMASVHAAATLLQKLGPPHEAGPLVATTAMYWAQTRGAGHPQQEQLQQLGVRMLMACAEARSIGEAQFQAWFEVTGLNDPGKFLPALDAALVALVGEGNWVFDRRALIQ
jgi:tetratricopeptide (TPR) repeat protein/CHAT domain-containing protein